MSGAIRGTLGTLTRGMMQLSGEDSRPVKTPIRIEYQIGSDEWSLVIFSVRIYLLRPLQPQISCRIGKDRYPCEIKDNKEKGTWSIKISAIGLWVKVRRIDIINTIGKEG